MNIASEPVNHPASGSDPLDSGVVRFLGLTGTDDGIKLNDIRSKAASELKRFGDDLGQHLKEIDISVPPAIQLRSTEEGGVAVFGDHFGKEKIESFINTDTRLMKCFKEVEVLHEILRRAELRGTGQTTEGQHFNLGLTSLGSIAFFSAD